LEPTWGATSRDIRARIDEIAGEIGCDRADVCGQRLVEIRAWELAAERADDIVRGGGEAALVDRLVGELGEVIATVNRLTRRPRSALWRGASDRLAQALVLAGDEAGSRELGERAARRALALDGPLAGAVRIEVVRVDGLGGSRNDEPVLVRNGCCLWHRVPGEPKCSTCPLLPDHERGARLAEELREALAAGEG
jgi:hypothetical protein